MNIKDATVGSCVKDQQGRLGLVTEILGSTYGDGLLRLVFVDSIGGIYMESVPPTGLTLISQA